MVDKHMDRKTAGFEVVRKCAVSDRQYDMNEVSDRKGNETI